MQLDPQISVILEQAVRMGIRPVEELTPEAARAQMEQALALVAPPPEPIARVEDRMITGPGGPLPLRLYTPGPGAALPALVFFHGGGWVLGGLETYEAFCRSLANGVGCLCVSVGYRLAPEHKFPAAVEDCYAATRWVAENAAALGADPLYVAVGGDSAGGNLAAAAALMARDRGGPRLFHQMLIYPALDAGLDTESYKELGPLNYVLSRQAMAWYWGHYLACDRDRLNPYACPARAETLAGLPAATVLTAGFDPLRDEGEAYAERLRKSGVAAELMRYPAACHGFLSIAVDERRRAIDDLCGALRRAFGPAGARA